MHELGIANSVLEAVQAEAARHPGAVVRKVALTIGELAGVDPDALAFSFEAITAGTEWAQLALEIETKPRLNRCPGCARVFRVIDYSVVCPECGNLQTESAGGEELQLAYLEMEEL